jgi:hypothetical protein
MRVHGAVLGFMGLWFGLLTVIFALAIAATVSRGKVTVVVIAPVGFYIFGYALMTGGFKLESRRARAMLNQLLRAGPLPPDDRSEYGPEGGWIRWRDIRGAGALGFAWVGLYVAGGALGLYDWIIRQAGCTNQEAHDPSYICPSGARVFLVWGVFAALMGVTIVGIWPVRRRRARLLVPIVAVQLVAVAVLAWFAGDPAFHVRTV